MKKSTVKILINDVEFTLREGSELLGIPYPVLVNKTIESKSFEYNGYKVERISPIRAIRGTILKCVETNKVWPSLRAFFSEAGIKNTWCYNVNIRKHQKFKYKGNTYVALNYKEIKHTSHAGKHAKYDIQNADNVKPTTDIHQKDEVQVNVDISVESKAINSLRELAIERIKKASYDKAGIVLQALELLTK